MRLNFTKKDSKTKNQEWDFENFLYIINNNFHITYWELNQDYKHAKIILIYK